MKRALPPGLTLGLTLALLLVACQGGSPTTPGLTPAPSARTPKPSATPSAATPTPGPGPTAIATNRPSVTTRPAPTPLPTPTPATAFGAVALGQPADREGLDPREADFELLTGLQAGAGGALWATDGRRVWSLPADGPVRLAAGRHLVQPAAYTGQPAADVGLGQDRAAIHPDGEAGLLIQVEGPKLLRLAADGAAGGTLTALWEGAGGEALVGAVRGDAGAVSMLVASGYGAGRTYAWWSTRPGASPIRRRSVVGEEAAALEKAADYGTFRAWADGGAKLLVLEPGGGVLALRPEGGAPEHLGVEGAAWLDGRGQAWAYDEADGILSRLRPGRSPEPLAARLPAGFFLDAVASAADGTVYAAGVDASAPSRRIYRLAGDDVERLAGVVAPALGPPDLTAARPWALAALGDAELAVADILRGRLLRVRPGQVVTPITGDPKDGAEPRDGGAAADAALTVHGVATDGRGALFVLHKGREIWRIDAAGKLARRYAHPAADPLMLQQVAVAPDGTLYAATASAATPQDDGKGGLLRIDEAGTATPVGIPAGTPRGLVVDAAGKVHTAVQAAAVGYEGSPQLQLVTVAATGRIATVATRAWRRTMGRALGVLAVDAQGRWLMATGNDGGGAIARFDPADGTSVPVAGHGTARLGADTAAGGLRDPRAMALRPDGTAYVADEGQVKRVDGL